MLNYQHIAAALNITYTTYTFRRTRYLSHCRTALRSRDVISQVTISFIIGSFIQVVNYNHASILHGYIRQYGALNILRSRPWFWDHVTSSVTWPLDSQHMVSYKWFIETTRLSRIVAKILRVKHLAITVENTKPNHTLTRKCECCKGDHQSQ